MGTKVPPDEACHCLQAESRRVASEFASLCLRKVSDGCPQFNFYDHSKLILSSHGNLITHIDKHYKMTRWSLSEVMAQSLQFDRPAPPALPHDPDASKFNQKLVDKLKYCKEVLISIRTASAGTAGEETDGPAVLS